MLFFIHLGLFNIVLAIAIVGLAETNIKTRSKPKSARRVKVSSIGHGVFLNSMVALSEVQDA